jgi:hypothetical protein
MNLALQPLLLVSPVEQHHLGVLNQLRRGSNKRGQLPKAASERERCGQRTESASSPSVVPLREIHEFAGLNDEITGLWTRGTEPG